MNEWPLISAEPVTAHPAVRALIEDLRQRFRDDIRAVLIYGSGLRAADPSEGLLDLYLLCDSYLAAHGRHLPALANRLLPPNVYYAQADSDGTRVRAKVALLSLDDFVSGCSKRRFESYLWGRFAQPIALAWYRDAVDCERVRSALLDAQYTLLSRTLAALPAAGSIDELWSAALAMSYSSELRTERSGRAAELTAWQPAFYRRALEVAQQRGLPLTLTGTGYAHGLDNRRATERAWTRRRALGKLLSVLRLLKAFFTFDGGVEYLVWKLERHSGESIPLPDRVRRYPLLFAWGFFWRLYRRGIFR